MFNTIIKKIIVFLIKFENKKSSNSFLLCIPRFNMLIYNFKESMSCLSTWQRSKQIMNTISSDVRLASIGFSHGRMNGGGRLYAQLRTYEAILKYEVLKSNFTWYINLCLALHGCPIVPFNNLHVVLNVKSYFWSKGKSLIEQLAV